MTLKDQSSLAIELVDLTKTYANKTVVDRLTLRIPRGRIFGLIGPNGAGKSTTIRMLMGMIPMSSGSARVLGLELPAGATRVKQRVGYVPETHHIYGWMRVHEVLAFARSFYESWNDSVCASMLDRFEIDEKQLVKHLSKGLLSKFALLLATAHEPDLLILDEPMSGMDPLARDEFLDGVVRTLFERECTVLFSSHSLVDVQRLADSVGILAEGRLLVDCNVDELLRSTKRIDAVLRDGCVPSRPPNGTIWQTVRQREWSLTMNGFTPETIQRINSENPVEAIAVRDLNLEEVLKYYLKGLKLSQKKT